MEDSDAEGEIEDLLAYFEQQFTLESSFPKICTPQLEMTQMHISGKEKKRVCFIRLKTCRQVITKLYSL